MIETCQLNHNWQENTSEITIQINGKVWLNFQFELFKGKGPYLVHFCNLSAQHNLLHLLLLLLSRFSRSGSFLQPQCPAQSLTPAAAAAKLLQSCPTLCNPVDGSPPGSPAPGILQATTLEWVAISFSNAWKWKVKVKSLSRVWLLATPWTAAYQAPLSLGFFRQELLEWSAIAFSILHLVDI